MPLLNGLIDQDVRMIAQEQASFNQTPSRHNYEVNPALARVQRLIRRQSAVASPIDSVDSALTPLP